MNASETKLQQKIEGEKQYAASIQKFCYQAMQAIDLTSDDWSVKVQPSWVE